MIFTFSVDADEDLASFDPFAPKATPARPQSNPSSGSSSVNVVDGSSIQDNSLRGKEAAEPFVGRKIEQKGSVRRSKEVTKKENSKMAAASSPSADRKVNEKFEIDNTCAVESFRSLQWKNSLDEK